MAVRLVKIVSLLLFFIMALLIFLPKKNLYYYAERELKNYKAVIDNEQVSSRAFGLDIENANLYIEHIRVAKIMDLHITTYLIYNVIEAKQIRLSGVARSFLPTQVDQLKISYRLWDPLEIVFEANAPFGKVRGSIFLKQKRVKLVLKPSKVMKNEYKDLLRKMRREKSGEYSYEQSL
ncbi:hypothetical protein MNB_SM-7-997 [hydrothermal vent metagenome]|uniref:Uncharacterized protein n=1 Tax=hydrothermal vent metagenome TaxID=652676 RepID=A0A1W1BKJ3_9ZZZZ